MKILLTVEMDRGVGNKLVYFKEGDIGGGDGPSELGTVATLETLKKKGEEGYSHGSLTGRYSL